MDELKVCLIVFFFEFDEHNAIVPFSGSATEKSYHFLSPLQRLMLKFSSMAPELERLNELGYRLPLNDSEIKSMQNLNRSWSTASAQTTERFR